MALRKTIQKQRCERLAQFMRERQLQNVPLASRVLDLPCRDERVSRLARRIGNWKGGHDPITPKFLVPMARALGVPPVELYLEPEGPKEAELFALSEASPVALSERNGHPNLTTDEASSVETDDELEPHELQAIDEGTLEGMQAAHRLRSRLLRQAMRTAGLDASDLGRWIAPIVQLPESQAISRLQEYCRPNGRKYITLQEILAISGPLDAAPSALWGRLLPWERTLLRTLEGSRHQAGQPPQRGMLRLSLRVGDRTLEHAYHLVLDRRSRSLRSEDDACRIGPDGKEVRLRIDDALDVGEYCKLMCPAP